MITKTLIIENKMGLHARPASLFVEQASQYDSDVIIGKDGIDVNGKSIMGILMLAAECGDEVTLQVAGSDEEDAMQAFVDLLKGKFNEE